MEFHLTNRSKRWSEGPSEAQFCLICLDTSEACKLYPANTYNLDTEFEHLTGLSLQGEMHLLQQFCTECSQRLSNCSKFRNKCLTAYHLLLELVEVNELLTAQNISSLRKLNNLTSSIGKKSFEPNHYDLCLIHKEQQDQQIQQELPNNKLTLKPVPENKGKIEDIEYTQEQEIQQELPYNKAIKVEVKSVNDKVIPNSFPEDEDIYYELISENVDDFQTKVEDLEDIDVDIDIDIERDEDANKVDNCIDNVINIINDSSSDNDLESDVVNNESYTENVNVTPVTCSKGKIKMVEISKKPKSKSKNLKESKKISKEVLDRELSKGYKITKLLSHEEQLAYIQKRKNLARFKTAPYKCMACYTGFRNRAIYNAHKERHTDKCGQFVCPICQLHFTRERLKNHHVAATHSTIYSCNCCPMVTNHKSVATNHQESHKGVIYKCPHCPVELRSKTGYLTHLNVNHPSDVVCALCGFCFRNERGLRRHLKSRHPGKDLQNVAGPLCEECNVRFESASAYEQHLAVSPKHAAVGTKPRRNDCQYLDKVNYLGGHCRDEDKAAVKRKNCFELLPCQQCDKQLYGVRAYNLHYKQRHPDKIRTDVGTGLLCEICGKSFPRPSNLQDHMISKHSHRKQFQCDICKKQFFLKNVLQWHIKMHTDERVYECPVCQKKFNFKSNCARHTLTHSEVKPIKCDVCDKTYVDENSVRWHIQHVHLKKPYPKKQREKREKREKHRVSRGHFIKQYM